MYHDSIIGECIEITEGLVDAIIGLASVLKELRAMDAPDGDTVCHALVTAAVTHGVVLDNMRKRVRDVDEAATLLIAGLRQEAGTEEVDRVVMKVRSIVDRFNKVTDVDALPKTWGSPHGET